MVHRGSYNALWPSMRGIMHGWVSMLRWAQPGLGYTLVAKMVIPTPEQANGSASLGFLRTGHYVCQLHKPMEADASRLLLLVAPLDGLEQVGTSLGSSDSSDCGVSVIIYCV